MNYKSKVEAESAEDIKSQMDQECTVPGLVNYKPPPQLLKSASMFGSTKRIKQYRTGLCSMERMLS